MMRIGIDMKPFFSGSKYRGIGTYSLNLVEEILRQDREDEFFFLNLYGDYGDGIQMTENCHMFRYHMGPAVEDVGERQLFRDGGTEGYVECAVRHFVETTGIDLMFFTSPNEYGNMYRAEWFGGTGKAAVLYDLIPLLFPKQFLSDPVMAGDYERSLGFLKGMDRLLAISGATKNDAVRKLGMEAEKISVIHAGIDRRYGRMDAVNVRRLKRKYGIAGPFLLFAGGIDFKKNIEGLIRAYAKCGKGITGRYQLVVAGNAAEETKGKYLRLAEEAGVGGRVVCTGFVPQEDLVELYNCTDLFVFPSLYEGFGLPVLEAMACGARVLTSDNSSLKEIAGGHATLVSAKSVRSISSGIRKVLSDPAGSMGLAEESIPYARSFTWEAVAEKVIKAFRGMQPEKKKIRTYEFSVGKDLLRRVANLYAKNGLPLTRPEAEELAEEMAAVESHAPLEEFNLKNRLLYDVTVVSEWKRNGYVTGIARASLQLMAELAKRMAVVPVVVSGGRGRIRCDEIDMSTFKIKQEDLQPRLGDIYFMPELHLRGVQVPEGHPPAELLRRKGIRCFSVVYDILPLRMPECFEDRTGRKFDAYVREAVENYDGVLCDSRSVADDVRRYCGEEGIGIPPGFRIGFFHLGQDTFENGKNEGASYSIKSFLEKDGGTYLMLGTVEPRKGHALVLDAFERMWEEGWDGKLCIAGHVGWNVGGLLDRIRKHPRYMDRLMFFENVEDREVAYLYQHSDCLVQASAGEGFGLPIIEAAEYGLPVICSDIPVFHEVAGDHVAYFDRTDPADLVKKIGLFEDGELEMRTEEIPRVTWRETAGKVYDMLVRDGQWYEIV